ncbi:hypothetical protein [Lentzea sp. NBRC 102530]|uniref:hypothetical protein n=1 Tax=Lentzea sp. NBRC 102530 TaxID=3032201 RepID=UPI0024A1F96C|nr:hypothetical protein [Lentzea sp. NBRC 102530]GLY55314.1 hypothetical protein Lesp01_89690 [Lentzea sp. NBRC 102530]
MKHTHTVTQTGPDGQRVEARLYDSTDGRAEDYAQSMREDNRDYRYSVTSHVDGE